MREKGLSEEELFSFLTERRSEDRGYYKVLSSMCTLPHPVAVRAHRLFLGTNLGDPGLFQGTASVERRLVSLLGDLVHHRGAGGYATSGGTESNIQALRIAKKSAGVSSPNVVIPESAHFSFDKACDMLSVEMRTAPSDAGFRMDAEAAEALVDKNTVAVVGVAGSTEYGVVDPIPTLSDICEDRGVFLHVDAAFGGLVLPFLDNAPTFDFSLPGVSSISIDPHKMGMSTIPAGCLLTRDENALSCLCVDTPYLTVNHIYTLCGTRAGAPVAAAYAVLACLGREGFSKIVAGCMANTRLLIDGMAAFDIPVITHPDVNVAAFDCPRTPDGWVVSRTRHDHLRIVCMPHIHRNIIDEFLSDMGEMLGNV